MAFCLYTVGVDNMPPQQTNEYPAATNVDQLLYLSTFHNGPSI